MLFFLLFSATCSTVASKIAPCLWHGANIIVKSEGGNIVTFAEIEKIDNKIVKCLKDKSFKTYIGCSNSSEICVTSQKSKVYSIVKSFHLQNRINFGARMILFVFLTVWLFRIYYGFIIPLLETQKDEEKITIMAVDMNFNPLTGIAKEYSNLVGIFRDFEEKHEFSHSMNFEVSKFIPACEHFTCVVFPIKNMPFRLVLVKKDKFVNEKIFSALDYDNSNVYREDCLESLMRNTYIFPNNEAGVDTENSKIRIKRIPGYFYSQNAMNYQAYRTIIFNIIRDTLNKDPTVENFKKIYEKIFKILDFDAVCFFIVRSGITKVLIKLGDKKLHNNMIDIGLNVESTELGKTSFITNRDGVKYVTYSYTIGETNYVTCVSLRLSRFILRGPERMLSLVLTLETIFYHMNLSNTNETMQTEKLINFIERANMFRIIEVDKVNGKCEIVSSAGKLFNEVKTEEITKEICNISFENESTKTLNLFGKNVEISLAEVNSEPLQKMLCIYMITDVTAFTNDDRKIKEIKSDSEIIHKNLGKINLIDGQFNIKDTTITKELGYTEESITNILEFLLTEDATSMMFLENKNKAVFRLRDVNGNGVWYGSKKIHRKDLLPYTNIIFRLPDLGDVYDINKEVQELDETLLLADRKGFGIWFIDQSNGHVSFSIPSMENIICDYIDLIGYVYSEDKQVFTDCIRTMNGQIKQIRTVRMNFASRVYEWYECTFYMTSQTNGIIIAVNVNHAKNMSDELIEVQEQIDLSLYHSNIVQWEYSDEDNSTQIFTNVPVAFQALPLNMQFIEHNVSNDYQEITKNAFRRCLELGEPINIEIPIVLDRIIWISLRGGRSEAGDRLFGVYFDMTELINIKEDLSRQKQSAINASLAKSEFLANMSHEIRAPLQGIIAVLELLILSSTTPTMHESLMTIKIGFYRLLELLNDTLDLAKIEQGRMLPSFCSFSPTEAIEPIIVHFRQTIIEKNIKLILNCNATVPIKYEGDPHFVERVVHNFVSNAIKFTSKGNISITVDGDEDTLKVMVKDTGIGIPEDMQKVMFNTFTKLDSSLTRPYQGSGVGLSVVAKFVQLVNGRIEVESTPGKGSTFAAIFPFKATYYPYITHRLKDNKFMVVNTSGVTFTPVQLTYFDFYGFIHNSYPPKENYPIRLIIVSNTESDIRIAKELKKKHQHAQILVAVREKEKPLSVPEGADIVFYPFFPSRFHKRLYAEKRLKHVRLSNPMSVSTEISELNKRVLVADDNTTNQIVMSKILSKMKCTYKCVSNGQEVIDALSEEEFDIILMDQHMPVLDGPGATKVIRSMKDKPYNSIPIVAMTASILQEDEELCLKAGVTAFVTKPVSMAELAKVITELVK